MFVLVDLFSRVKAQRAYMITEGFAGHHHETGFTWTLGNIHAWLDEAASLAKVCESMLRHDRRRDRRTEQSIGEGYTAIFRHSEQRRVFTDEVSAAAIE